MTRTFFTTIPSRALYDLTHAEFKVLGIMCSFINRYNECWPSYSTIADKCKISRRNAIDYIKKLSLKGYLDITKRTFKNKSNSTNIYRVIFDDKMTTPENEIEIYDKIPDEEDEIYPGEGGVDDGVHRKNSYCSMAMENDAFTEEINQEGGSAAHGALGSADHCHPNYNQLTRVCVCNIDNISPRARVNECDDEDDAYAAFMRDPDQMTQTHTHTPFKNDFGEESAVFRQSVSEEMAECWNKTTGQSVIVSSSDDELEKKLDVLFGGLMNLWEDYCEQIGKSDFLMGRKYSTGMPFELDINWALKKPNVTSVLSGKYDNHVYGKTKEVKSLPMHAQEESVFYKNTRFPEPYGEIHDRLVQELGLPVVSSWFHTVKITPNYHELIFMFKNRFMADSVTQRFEHILRNCVRLSLNGKYTNIRITT